MANEGYHKPLNELSADTRDMHRAIVSLMEELEAVDWYNQRVDACKDVELKSILKHNADEEKEHAAMLMEWIRRRDPVFDKELGTVHHLIQQTASQTVPINRSQDLGPFALDSTTRYFG